MEYNVLIGDVGFFKKLHKGQVNKSICFSCPVIDIAISMLIWLVNWFDFCGLSSLCLLCKAIKDIEIVIFFLNTNGLIK